MQHIKDTVLPSLKLYEYYVLDVASHKDSFKSAWSKASKVSKNESLASLSSKSIEEQAQVYASECLPADWCYLGKRFHATPDTKKAIAFVSSLLNLTPSADSADQATEHFGKLEDVLNVERYKEFDEDKKAILDNTSGRIKYTRLEEHGPKKGEVTEKYA